MPSVVIVGGGVSGLAAAYRLEQRAPDLDVTLLEANPRPGGTVWTRREEGFTLEIGPNGFLDTKPTTLELCRDLGLGDQLLAASEASGKNRYLFWQGRLQALPSSLWSFIKSPLLSWRGKLSLILERFREHTVPDDESIDAFARRRTGPEIAAVLADAMVTGIYAGDPKKLSLPACFPRLAALEREYGSVLKGFGKQARQRRAEAKARGEAYQRPGKLWSFRDGLRVMIEALVEKLRKPPVLGVAVRGLRRIDQRWRVLGEGKESWDADAVVLACPAHQQAAILQEVDPVLAAEVGAIPYNRIAVIGLGYRGTDVAMNLDGFGYIAPQSTGRDLLGVQWCSSIYPGRAPAGMVLLRGLCGGEQRAEMVGWDDERLVRAAREELRVTQGISAAPLYARVARWDRAIPQYHLGHLERVRRIEERLKGHTGLFLGGNAYRGVALNDCTEQGKVLAERVEKAIDKRRGFLAEPS